MRSWTQLAHREPPYARWTVFLGRLTVAYSRGRRAGTPGSFVPQSWNASIHSLQCGNRRAYTALGGSALLLDVQVSELSTGGLVPGLASHAMTKVHKRTNLDLHAVSMAQIYCARNHLPLGHSGCWCCTALVGAAQCQLPVKISFTPHF